eukprot:Hpha_TRINITY_DN11473_c0_g1::TRINITY_DN11473_c0_g1_i1::g.137617::m.137617/K18079/TPTE, TPIP; PTEN homologous phosphatase
MPTPLSRPHIIPSTAPAPSASPPVESAFERFSQDDESPNLSPHPRADGPVLSPSAPVPSLSPSFTAETRQLTFQMAWAELQVRKSVFWARAGLEPPEAAPLSGPGVPPRGPSLSPGLRNPTPCASVAFPAPLAGGGPWGDSGGASEDMWKLEEAKMLAVSREDFDEAKRLKDEIGRLQTGGDTTAPDRNTTPVASLEQGPQPPSPAASPARPSPGTPADLSGGSCPSTPTESVEQLSMTPPAIQVAPASELAHDGEVGPAMRTFSAASKSSECTSPPLLGGGKKTRGLGGVKVSISIPENLDQSRASVSTFKFGRQKSSGPGDRKASMRKYFDGNQSLLEPLLNASQGGRTALRSPKRRPSAPYTGVGMEGMFDYASAPSEAWASDDDKYSFAGGWQHDDDADGPEPFDTPAARRPSNCQERLRAVLYSIPCQVFMLLLTIVDICILIALVVVEVQSENGEPAGALALHLIALFDILIFYAEFWCRALIETCRRFFQSTWNWVEMLVVSLGVILEICYLGLRDRGTSGTVGLIVCLVIVRVARTVFVIRFRLRMGKAMGEATVSQARHRYIKDGYELDLTYITPKIIATSWPSSGFESVYRNHIEDVAKFLEKTHHGTYKVYNLCAERAYKSTYFGGQVERVLIDDHQPCELKVLQSFCESADQYLSEDDKNVIVVHCKGGKGRTGLAICGYLLHSGAAKTAAQAMRMFGEKRTAPGSAKVQTVECPSQRRYLWYWDHCIRNRSREAPSGPPLRLTCIRVGPLPRDTPWPSELCCVVLGGGRGEVLWVSDAHRQRTASSSSPSGLWGRRGSSAPSPSSPCPTDYTVHLRQPGGRSTSLKEAGEQRSYTAAEYHDRYERGSPSASPHSPGNRELYMKYTLKRPVIVRGDFRIHFMYQSTPESNWNESSVWWTWLHTSFIDPLETFRLRRSQVDGPHKDHDCLRFPANFGMELDFDPPAEETSFLDGDSVFHRRGSRRPSRAPEQ